MSEASAVLAEFNGLPVEAAAAAILPCNGSGRWAREMAALRPFATVFDLTCTADRVWLELGEADWQEAFATHPRIGERHAGAASEASLRMSAQEQEGARLTAALERQLVAANHEYEARFGRIFLVCATGKTAAGMLELLAARLRNDPATELREAVEQQRQITQIRLRRWLGAR